MSTGHVLEAKREYFDPAPCRLPTPDSSSSSPTQSHIISHHHHHHHRHLNHHLSHHLNTSHFEPDGRQPSPVDILSAQPAAAVELLVQHLAKAPVAADLKLEPVARLSGLSSAQSRTPSTTTSEQRQPIKQDDDDNWRSIPLHDEQPPVGQAEDKQQAAAPGNKPAAELEDKTTPQTALDLKAQASDKADEARRCSRNDRLSFQQTSETGYKTANLNLEAAKLGKIAKFQPDDGMELDRKHPDKDKVSDRRRKSSQCSRLSFSSSKPQIGYRRPPFMFAGIAASILGSVFFSFSTLTIKLLPDGQGLAEKTQIALWRGVVMGVLCAGAILKSGCGFLVPRDEILINVLRSVFGFFGIFMSYIALKYISMGDATALVFSSPVWTSLLSHYILHEPLQWIQLLALPLSMLGIILIAHPALIINMEHKSGALERQPLLDPVELQLPNGTTNSSLAGVADEMPLLNQDLDIAMNASEHFDMEHRWKGIVIALGCSFVVSLVYIVLKFRKSTPIQVATFWLAFTTAAFSLALGSFTGLGEFPTEPRDLILLLLNGCSSWLGQSLLQWALMYENASVLSVIRTLDVAMSFSLSAIFLEEEILWTSILGAAIIASVVVSIMLSSYIQSKLCPASSVLEVEEGELEVETSSSSRGSNSHVNTDHKLDSIDTQSRR